jgi:hypothetical protein
VRVVCREHGIEESQVASAWKEVSTQSERQLGAFSFLYLIESGETLPLNPEIPRIRNRIVHQGRLAKEADARDFGSMVFQRLRDIEGALRRYPASAEAEKKHEIENQEKSVPAGMEHGTLTVWSMNTKDGEVIGPVESFDHYLEALQQSLTKGLA